MDLADRKFECGRKKGKTYKEVKETDPDFCKMVLSCPEANRFYPEDFKQYLRAFEAVPEVIKEVSAKHFLERLNPAQKLEFRTIIMDNPERKLPIYTKHINEEIDEESSGFLGIFCRLFMKKCVRFLQLKVGSDGFADNCASIFPFVVSSDVEDLEISIKKLFDDRFAKDVKNFVGSHFDDVDSEAAVDLFLRNIFVFRRNHFSRNDVAKLQKFVGIVSGPCATSRRVPFHGIEYFRKFPRLNSKGVNRYSSFVWMYKEIAKHYGFSINPVVRSFPKYFQYLPESNIHEILSLLDRNLYVKDYNTYVQRFLKYLFFFIHAERSPQKPVFFIDDALFECLKELQNFRKCFSNPLEQKKTIALIAAVKYRNKKALDAKNITINNSNLQLILDYVSGIPNIESADSGGEIIKTDVLQFHPPVRVEDTFYDLSFAKSKMTHRDKFYELILEAALHPSTIRKIVRYNPKRGIEYSLHTHPKSGIQYTLNMLPEKVEEIRNFVEKYNEYDFSVEPPKERFLTRGIENCFEKDTIDWEEKYRQT